MIFVGELTDLEARYHETWSGLCRGNKRSAYSIGAEGIELRSDFLRWLGRQAIKNKGGNMILKRTIKKHGLIVLVFQDTEKDGEKKTVEQMVAEAVIELGKDGQGVPCSGIHFAAFGHPFSAAQRLRELKDKFERARVLAVVEAALSQGKTADSLPVLAPPYRFVKAENKYYFSREFIDWLRTEYIEKEPLK